MRHNYTYHSNHFRCKTNGWPELWVNDEKKKPECNAAPDGQMRKLFNNITHRMHCTHTTIHSQY